MAQITLHGKVFKKYILEATIQARIQALAATLEADYKDKDPLFVAVLNGSFLFAADLFRHFEMPCEITFVKLSSYEGMTSTGEVNEAIGLDVSVEGRHVIVLEDIVDTGKTLHDFIPTLVEQGAASVKIATLLHKPDAIKYPLVMDYVGFVVPNAFLLGYGLDFDQKGRNLRDIYQLDE